MKVSHFLTVFFILSLFVSGCTIELKATDLEATGQMSGVYELDNIRFTEREKLWPSSNSAAESSMLADL